MKRRLNKSLSARSVVWGLLLLFFGTLLCGNSLLQAPRKISKQEIKAIEQESIKEGWEATWERLLQHNKSIITFNCHNGVVEIDLVWYDKLHNCIDEKSKRLFKFSKSIKEGKSVPTYFLHIGVPPKQEQTQEKLDERSPNNESYTISKRRDFTKTPQQHNPKTLTVQKLGEIIRTRHVIFYTGAGISAAVGVWMMQPLMDALGIDPANNCDHFIQEVLVNPEKKQQVFAQFCERAFTAQSTPAHNALASIALAKQTQILTENFDLLHEHTGIKVQHITGPWLKANVKSDDLKDIDIVVCVALSYDDRGFLGWYKENNPKGTIVAIDLLKPSYLGNEDFLLQGDCQKVLPELQQQVSRLMVRSELLNSKKNNK